MEKKQLSLGEFIELLKTCPKENNVIYDFGYMVPTDLYSYRGYYDEIALGFEKSDSGNHICVSDLLKECESAIGFIYNGYKGGEYKMTKDTPVWVSNYGDADNTIIIGIHNTEFDTTIIDTTYKE